MTFCQYNILSAIFCPVTFSPATLVGIQPSCSRPDKMGYVQSQYRKFEQRSLVRTLSVWLVCDRSGIDGLPVVGFIASRSDGCFLLVLVVWSDLWSVVGLPAGLFAIQSVGWLSHPAGLLYPTYHRLTSQPSIHLSDRKPTDHRLYFYQRLRQISA